MGELDPKKLQSPTCRECAIARGYVPVTDIFTVYHGACANCGEEKTVSSSGDWKRPGEIVHGWD